MTENKKKGWPRMPVSPEFWAVLSEAAARTGGYQDERERSLKIEQLFDNFCNKALKSWAEGNKTMNNSPTLLAAVKRIKFELYDKILKDVEKSIRDNPIDES